MEDTIASTLEVEGSLRTDDSGSDLPPINIELSRLKLLPAKMVQESLRHCNPNPRPSHTCGTLRDNACFMRESIRYKQTGSMFWGRIACGVSIIQHVRLGVYGTIGHSDPEKFLPDGCLLTIWRVKERWFCRYKE
jgi:hypothetical protein